MNWYSFARVLVVMVISAPLAIAIVVTIALRSREYHRVYSPDGRHVAVIKYRAYLDWLPAFPGSSGDKQGWAEITTLEENKIGQFNSAPVSQFQSLRWEADSVRLPGGGEVKLPQSHNVQLSANR